MTKRLRLLAVAPAKVNLGLEVTRRRSDGYHDLVTLVQAVSLFDLFEWVETGDTFSYAGPPGVSSETDLVARVLAMAPDRAEWTGRLRLIKRIPMAAGLGGGSADAALALQLAFPNASLEELHERGSALGADVPFFLRGGTALATGTGTDIEWLPSPSCWIILITPPLEIERKTAALYGGLTEADFTDGRTVQDLAIAIRTNRQIEASDIPNAFLRQLLRYDVVRYAYDALWRSGSGTGGGVVNVSASGAGPTIYALSRSWRHATSIADRLLEDVGRVHIVRSIGPRSSDHAIQCLAKAMRGQPT